MAKVGYKKKRDDEAITNIANNMRMYRKLKGLTQSQLAFNCEVDTKQISKMELAQVDTNVTMLTLVAKHLKITVGMLFEKYDKTKDTTLKENK